MRNLDSRSPTAPIPTCEHKRGQGTYRLWQAMRARRVFTVDDLDELQILKRTSTIDYCNRLVRHGVLCSQIVDGRRTYRLIRDLGPLAPVIIREGGIRDPNQEPRPYEYQDPRSESAVILDTLLRLPCWTCCIERDSARRCDSCGYAAEDRPRLLAAAERATQAVRRVQRPRGNHKGAHHV
ncbi:MAG: hypothetical protein LBM75_09335 [Myxococcales bacterium]|jgi:hypothetical protein|nr:hypothetical protein [Myxococcales bacterium]